MSTDSFQGKKSNQFTDYSCIRALARKVTICTHSWTKIWPTLGFILSTFPHIKVHFWIVQHYLTTF